MENRLNRSLRRGSLAIISIGLAACQTNKHTMVEPAPATTIACKQCYTQIETVRAAPGGRWSGADRVIKEHQCPDCKTDMSIYSDGDVLKVKCAHCAPAGIACDKCLPPDSVMK
jgi:hypothetical protein